MKKFKKTVIKSIMYGLGSIGNLSGEYTMERDTRTDAEKLASDWQMVGNDIRNAMSIYGKSL